MQLFPIADTFAGGGSQFFYGNTADSLIVRSGSTAQWVIKAHNDGNVPMENVVISDPTEPSCSKTYEFIQPGQYVYLICETPNITHTTINTATLSAEYFTDNSYSLSLSGSATAIVPEAPISDLLVKKTGVADTDENGNFDTRTGDSTGELNLGALAKYTISYSSSGTTALDQVVFEDTIPTGTCIQKDTLPVLSGAIIEVSVDSGSTWLSDIASVDNCDITTIRVRLAHSLGNTVSGSILPWTFTGSIPDIDYVKGTAYTQSGISLNYTKLRYFIGEQHKWWGEWYDTIPYIYGYNHGGVLSENPMVFSGGSFSDYNPTFIVLSADIYGYPQEVFIYDSNNYSSIYELDNGKYNLVMNIQSLYSALQPRVMHRDAMGDVDSIFMVQQDDNWIQYGTFINKTNGVWTQDRMPNDIVAWRNIINILPLTHDVNGFPDSVMLFYNGSPEMRHYKKENGVWVNHPEFVSAISGEMRHSFNTTNTSSSGFVEFFANDTSSSLHLFNNSGGIYSQSGGPLISGNNWSKPVYIPLQKDTAGNTTSFLYHIVDSYNAIQHAYVISHTGDTWGTGFLDTDNPSFASITPVTFDTDKNVTELLAITPDGRGYVYTRSGDTWVSHSLDATFPQSIFSIIITEKDASENIVSIYAMGRNYLNGQNGVLYSLKKDGPNWTSSPVLSSSQGPISSKYTNPPDAYIPNGYRDLIFPTTSESYDTVKISQTLFSGTTTSYDIGIMDMQNQCTAPFDCTQVPVPYFYMTGAHADNNGEISLSGIVFPAAEYTPIVRAHLNTTDTMVTPYIHTVELVTKDRLPGSIAGSFSYVVQLQTGYSGDTIVNTVTGSTTSMQTDISNDISTHTFVVKTKTPPSPPEILAVSDTIHLLNNNTGSIQILLNDAYSGSTPTLDTVVASLSGTSPIPGLSIDANGVMVVPPSTREGTYSVFYTICDKLNPTNCSSAPVQIVLKAPEIIPPAVSLPNIQALADSGSFLSTETGTIDLFANDSYSGSVATKETVTVSLNKPVVGMEISSGGILSISPGATAGSRVIQYTICDKTHPSHCSTAPISLTITNPPVQSATPVDSVVTTGGPSNQNVTPIPQKTIETTELTSAPTLPTILFPTFVPSCTSAVKNLDDPRLSVYFDEIGVVDKTNIDRRLTRVEFLKLVLNAAKVDLSKAPRETSFQDVRNNTWYAPYVSYAKAAGIISGDTTGNFRPNDMITRAEASKIFVQVLGVKPIIGKTSFADIPKSSTLGHYVEAAYESCLVHGRNTLNGEPREGEERKFEPHDTISLGETGKVLYNSTHQSGE